MTKHQMSIIISKNLHRKFKVVCSLKGRELSDVAQDIIRDWVEEAIRDPDLFNLLEEGDDG